MANTVKMKQSAVAGKVPTTAQLALGELAINTVDGKLFLKKNVGGTESVVDVIAVAAAAGGGFPSGTAMLFAQTAAPTGWTKSTTHNDKALRVVNGTAGSGGTVAFSTAFASQAVNGSIANATAAGSISSTTATNQSTTSSGTVGNTTLSISQVPSHRHDIVIPGSQGGTSQRLQSDYLGGGSMSGAWPNIVTGIAAWGQQTYASDVGGSGAHNHSLAMNAHTHTQDAHSHTFTGTAHNHTFTGTAIDLAVQYVDVIIATKD